VTVLSSPLITLAVLAVQYQTLDRSVIIRPEGIYQILKSDLNIFLLLKSLLTCSLLRRDLNIVLDLVFTSLSYEWMFKLLHWAAISMSDLRRK
jgi:hypothetical protein